MKLYEHEGAELFSARGIPVPPGMLAATPDGAVACAEKIGFPVMIKAQVLSGGRGLSGGIRSAANSADTKTAAADLLGSVIQGMTVQKLLVVPKLEFKEEFYLGITIDGYTGNPVVMVSTKGGMNIETVAGDHPDDIATFRIDVNRGLFAFEARNLLKSARFPHNQMSTCADVLIRLYRVFKDNNAMVAEINPLVVLTDGRLMALDAKLEVDDSALFRLKDRLPKDHDRNESPLERLGREKGVTYVELDGDIGIISSGAGLGMATMDIIGQRLRPANFLETGGGITEELLYETMDLVMAKKGLRAVFINLYGGINPIHEGARGIVRYIQEHDVRIPIVAKALGNRQEETWDIFRSGGVHVVTDVATETAVEELIDLLA